MGGVRAIEGVWSWFLNLDPASFRKTKDHEGSRVLRMQLEAGTGLIVNNEFYPER